MSKLNWGLIGGGEGSQIGPAHRISAAMDGLYCLVAGALDHNPDKGRAFAQELGIVADRAYRDWREMLEGERNRHDRVDLVTVATPNSTHYEITKAFLEAGIAVLCEKPMTVTVEEAEDIAAVAKRALSADFVTCLKSRTLEDDALVNFRMDGGAVLRLWTSSIAVGSMHGLNIRVYGEKGGLRWAQEWPNQLFWTPLNGRTEILERGGPNLSPEADRASRVTIGHAEGMPLAFANIYSDIAEVLNAKREGRAPDPLAMHFPTALDGLRSIAAIRAAVESAKAGGAWVDARPPSLR